MQTMGSNICNILATRMELGEPVFWFEPNGQAKSFLDR